MERVCSTCKWKGESTLYGKHCGPCFEKSGLEPKTERNNNLASCSECTYAETDINAYPCRDCRNKCHFRRKGAMMIDYDMITNASLTAAINNIPKTYNKFKRLPDIKNVIFNDPATIVFWSDGTKTVVKCQDGEPYDAEKGLAMAISKKALGNQGNYCNVFKKWLPEEEEIDSKEIELVYDVAALAGECKKAMETIVKSGSNFSAKKGV